VIVALVTTVIEALAASTRSRDKTQRRMTL